MAVSFRPHTGGLPLRILFVFLLAAAFLFINPFGWFSSSVPGTSSPPGHFPQEEKICRIDDHILTTTTTKTVITPPQTVTVTARPKETPYLEHDGLGFPIAAHTQPSPEDTIDAIKPEAHFYRKDGLLEVNPNAAHPIFELMDEAETQWKAKNARASKTLKQACDEYERRNNRRPPLGFDIWWTYARSYNVLLPDEYDTISQDIEPFWGVDPRRLQAIQSVWEGQPDSFTVGKATDKHPITMLNYTFGDPSRTEDLTRNVPMIIELVEEVQDYIPNFRATFSPHDGPNLHSDYELMEMAKAAAKAGRYIDHDQPPPVKLHGWKSACAPDSPAWANPVEYANPLPSLSDLTKMKYNSSYASSNSNSAHPKTFIHKHEQAMDACLHPAHLFMHGQFLSHERGPVPHRMIVPQFSLSPTALHHDIRVALPYSWAEDTHDVEFDKKDDDRLEWRGSNTGMWFTENNQWWLSQRPRLVDWANPQSRQETLVVTDSVLGSPPDKRWKVGTPKSLEGNGTASKKSSWAPGMADVAFSNRPLTGGCNSPEGHCPRLVNDYEFRKSHNIPTQGRYKYIMDVDGNAWSSRFKRLITTNSLIFKSTVYREWFSDRIQPWLHYVPIQVDYSDLLDTLYFFRGDPSGHGAHPELAKKIAESGRQWSLDHWRKPDLTAYMFRLFLEYARIMATDRENGVYDYEYDEADEHDDLGFGGEGRDFSENLGPATFGEIMERRRQMRQDKLAR